MININIIESCLLDLQTRIGDTLMEIDPQLRLKEDQWHREGGGGSSRVLSRGRFFEQAGINFSHVHGESLPPSATLERPELAGRPFQALGDSSVIHPLNPYIPAAHMNIRFFIAEARKADEVPIWWFGGGFDLTPVYGFEEDALHWHRTARAACAGFGGPDPAAYEKYKKWCDDYFYLKHRKEARGIGGLFYDNLNQPDFDSCFAFTRSVGDHFLEAYIPIVERRMHTAYGERQREFQLYRRGRYVEFNLIHDRGTRFGLQSGGRTESILMSLPPLARWEYDWRPEQGSPEQNLYDTFLKPRNWLE